MKLRPPAQLRATYVTETAPIVGGTSVNAAKTTFVDSTTVIPVNLSWSKQSVCVRHDRWNDYAVKVHVEVCRQCPVMKVCFWAAMLEERNLSPRYREELGVRGGTTAQGRIVAAQLLDRVNLTDVFQTTLQNYLTVFN
jgi:hypothetical protein